MRVKAIKDFISTSHGNVSAGQVLEVSEARARHFNAHGLTAPMEYETKVIHEVPSVAGRGKPSSSLPADQAQQKKTRRKRKKKGELSPSTVPSDSAQMQTPSMQGTANGGTTTGTTGETSQD